MRDAEPLIRVPGLEPSPSAVTVVLRRGGFGEDETLPGAEDPEWSVRFARLEEAWQLPLPPHGDGKAMGEGIVVGHPDTGYTRHGEIFDAARLLVDQGYDFTDDGDDPADTLEGLQGGHGTGTASVIMSGAGGGPGARVTGAAPRASLVPLRVTSTVALFDYGTLERALYYAADHKHDVVSISLGGAWGTRSLRRAVRYAVERGVIVLAAAGNYWPWVVYPACYDEVIAVAACNCQRGIWRHSSEGPEVDCTAPGESVWRARADDTHSTVEPGSGTSFAVATVAGACAVWLAFHGRARLRDTYGGQNLAGVFKEVMMRHGVDRPPGWDDTRHGAGILNARKLLQAPLPATPPARGLHTSRLPADASVATDFERVARHFPGVDRANLRRALEQLLGSDGRELERDLIDFADELAYHVAVNPGVRESLAQRATPRALTRATVRRPLRDHPMLFRNASRTLRKRVRAAR